MAAARHASLSHGHHTAVMLWRWSGRGARERRGAAQRQAGPACAAGAKGRWRPNKVKMRFFKLFSIPFSFKQNFELFQSSFQLWPKNKSCSKFIIYNFSFMTKVKFQIDFELQNKININSKP